MKKILQKTVIALFVVASCIGQTACCDSTPEANVPIKGTVTISENPVKNGDTVFLSIGSIPKDSIDIDSGGNGHTIIKNTSISVSLSMIEYNGEWYTYNSVPMVHYYIDDIEVGNSNEYNRYYGFLYKVSGLSVGEHTLSAKAAPQSNYVKFIGEYTSTKFTVAK